MANTNNVTLDTMDLTQMFDLQSQDLGLKILVFGDLPINGRFKKAEKVSPKVKDALSFSNNSFDLALCPNFSLSESEETSKKGPVDIILDLIRVASEVRIFPLTDKAGHPSMWVGSVIQSFQQKGFNTELRDIKNKAEASIGAMLRIWPEKCSVG